MKKERPRTFSIANHGVSITGVDNEEKEEIMDSVKIYNLAEIMSEREKNTRLNKNQMAIYSAKPSRRGKNQTHNISFSRDADFVKQGKMFFTIGENQFTGDIFLVFSGKFTGREIEIKEVNKRGQRVLLSRTVVVKMLAEKLGLDLSNGVNEIIDLSNNISKRDNLITYRILRK